MLDAEERSKSGHFWAVLGTAVGVVAVIVALLAWRDTASKRQADLIAGRIDELGHHIDGLKGQSSASVSAGGNEKSASAGVSSAKERSSPSTASTYDRQSAWKEVEPLARGYFAAGTSFDVDRELAYWHFPAREYYDRVNRTESQVRAEAGLEAASKEKVEVQLQVLQPVSWDPSAQRLTVRTKYWFKWRLRSSGKVVSGTSDVTAEWARHAGAWKIEATHESVAREGSK
jgi:hypothetical protein